MIKHVQAEEPDYFEAEIRQPGNAWLDTHRDAKRPRDYWTRCKPELQKAFQWLCSYCAMYEPVGTVDHYISYDEDKTKTYEWSNYRFAAQWINSSKQEASGLLDPFEVEDSWFEIILPSCQLRLSDQVPQLMLEKAQKTLKRLHLIHDERVVRQRREWLRMYDEKELTIEGLSRKAPLIAKAVRVRDGLLQQSAGV